MAFCGKCGAQLPDGTKFCSSCGAPVAPAVSQQPQTQQPQAKPQQQNPAQNDYAAKLQALNNTADTTAEYDAADIEQNKVMAILAYLGPLVLVPLFAAKTSKFARFHTNQGLVNCLASIAWSIVYNVVSAILTTIYWRLGSLFSIVGIVSVVFFILAVIGLLNAVNGRAKELPVIGKIKLLK